MSSPNDLCFKNSIKMKLKIFFLSLGIKSQIVYTIHLLTLLITVIYLLLIGTYCYEIWKESYRQQKQFYNDLQLLKLENIIHFQDLQLLLYEDLNKCSINQLMVYMSSTTWFNEPSKSFSDDDVKQFFIREGESCPKDTCIYYRSSSDFSNDSSFSKIRLNLFLLLTTFKVIKNIRLPFFGNNPIITQIILYNKEYNTYFSTDDSFEGNSINFDLNSDHEVLLGRIYDLNIEYINKINSKKLNYAYWLYHNHGLNYTMSNAHSMTFQQPIINYTSYEMINVDSSEKENMKNMIIGKITSSFVILFYLNFVKSFPEYASIPTKYDKTQNDYFLLSKLPCYYLQNIQDPDKATEWEENEMVNFKECFIEDDVKEQIEKFLNDYSNHWSEDMNTYMIENYYLMKLLIWGEYPNGREKNYGFIHSYFPNFNSWAYFIPKYISYMNVSNFSFLSMYFVKTVTVRIQQHLNNIWYLILLITVWIWHLVRFSLFFIIRKWSHEVTEPIINWKASVDSMTFTDASIFEYKDDDIINDLFVTCRDLLKGALIVQSNNDESKKALSLSNNNNIVINKEIADKISVDENICTYKCKGIGFSEHCKQIRKKTDCKSMTSEMREGSINERKENCDDFLNWAKWIFDEKTPTVEINKVPQMEKDKIKNKKCIYYHWYQEVKKKNQNKRQTKMVTLKYSKNIEKIDIKNFMRISDYIKK